MEYPHLKGYARFLLENHLDELTALNIARARAVRLPLLQLFSHYSEEELLAYSRQSLRVLLTDLADGVALEKYREGIQQWKNGQIPEVPSHSIDAGDLAFSPHTRKYALYRLLQRYTSDPGLYEAIVLEIDAFYTTYQADSMAAFVEIQQEMLQQERDYLQTIIDHTEDGISAYDQQGRLTLWNRALEERTGVLRTQVLGKSLWEMFPSYGLSEEGVAVQRVLRGERIQLLNRPFRDREGFYEAFLIPLTDTHGKVIGGLSVSRDISRRRKEEDSILKARDFYLTILEDFPALIWRANTDAKCDYFNRTWLSFTGRTLSEEQGDGWASGVHPDDMERCLKTYLSAFHERKSFQMEYRLRRYDGEYRWLLDIGKPFFDWEDNFMGYIGSCYDITGQKQATETILRQNQELGETLEELRSSEEHLRELNYSLEVRVKERTEELAATNEELQGSLEELSLKNDQLVRTNNDLDNFVYSASHDLKAPVTNLEGLMQVFERRVSPQLGEAEQRLMQMMQTSILKLKATINGLVQITKAQRNVEEEYEDVSLRELLEEVKEDVRHLLLEADPELEENFRVERIRFPRVHLHSIVYNLFSNALKYRAPGRRLKIKLASWQEGPRTVFCVADNGLGLSAAQRSKLFSMFKRLHTHVEGTGIGLYTIKRLVENYGGRIEAESEEGVGSVFRVYL